mgnify:CR=1 FL=1
MRRKTMPDDIEKINEIFRIHDENAKKKTGQTGKTLSLIHI